MKRGITKKLTSIPKQKLRSLIKLQSSQLVDKCYCCNLIDVTVVQLGTTTLADPTRVGPKNNQQHNKPQSM